MTDSQANTAYLTDATVKSANHFFAEIDEILADQSKAAIEFSDNLKALQDQIPLLVEQDHISELEAKEALDSGYEELFTNFEKEMTALRIRLLEMLIATSVMFGSSRSQESLDEIRNKVKTELQDQMLSVMLEKDTK